MNRPGTFRPLLVVLAGAILALSADVPEAPGSKPADMTCTG